MCCECSNTENQFLTAVKNDKVQVFIFPVVTIAAFAAIVTVVYIPICTMSIIHIPDYHLLPLSSK